MRLKNTFVQGKMNKDIDERLLPKGQYPHAENVRVANSESSDIGAVENMLGNKVLTSLDVGSNVKTIFQISDQFSDNIYWGIKSDRGSYVLEYNTETQALEFVLQDERTDNVLGFDEDFIITDPRILIDSDNDRRFLFLTDNKGFIKQINIERAKGYGLNGFVEEDIALIKRPPIYSPEIELTETPVGTENNMEEKFLVFAYRYKYLDGEYSSLSPFSEVAFNPSTFRYDFSISSNESMINANNKALISFRTGGRLVTDIEVVFKEIDKNFVYLVGTFNKEDKGWNDNVIEEIEFTNNKAARQLPERELFRLFDNVPKKAKALELIGNRLVLGNYTENYNMVDATGDVVLPSLQVSQINEATPVNTPARTLKSNRDYEIGIVYGDEYGRLTTVFTSDNNTANIGINKSTFSNKLKVEIDSKPPEFASFYRFCIKQLNFDYEVFVPTLFYQDGAFVWVKIEDADKDKINEGDFLFVKSDTGGLLNASVRTKILEIKDQPRNFLDTTGGTSLKQVGGKYAKIKPVGFRLYEDELNIYRTYGYASNSGFENYIGTNVNYIQQPVYYGLSDNNDMTSEGVYTGSVDNRYLVEIDGLNTRSRGTVVLQSGSSGSVDSITVNGVEVLSGSVPFNTDLETTAQDVVNNINSNITSPNYSAYLNSSIFVSGERIRISDLTGTSNGFVVNSTTTDIVTTNENFSGGGSNTFRWSKDNGATYEASGIPITEGIGQNLELGVKVKFESSTGHTLTDRWYLGAKSASDNGLGNDEDGWAYAVVKGDDENERIRAGARINFVYNEYGDRHEYVEKSFISGSSYKNLEEWFYGDNILAQLAPIPESRIWFRRGVVNSFGELHQINITDDGSGTMNMIFRSKGYENSNADDTARVRTTLEIVQSDNAIIFETKPVEIESDIFYEIGRTYNVLNGQHTSSYVGDISQTNSNNAEIVLPIYNAYAWGNGFESIKIRDAFNGTQTNITTRGLTSIEDYRENVRIASLTYGNVYEQTINYNGINEFNLSTVNFKDMDDAYGSVQKLWSRDTNLLVFQEDKTHKVLYNKSILFNADGTGNVSQNENVLGQEVAYTGEYGISLNPESFAFYGNSIWHTDTRRGCVLRLANNGYYEVSENGMRDYFRDYFRNFKDSRKYGSYDPYNDQYVLNLRDNDDNTVTFDEKVGGWTSFHSYIPDGMTQLNNKFYTIKEGELYEHNREDVPRNTYYGVYYPSKISAMVNEMPSEIKSLQAVSLEGNRPWNLDIKAFINSQLDFKSTTIRPEEFVNKEGFWFSYSRRNEIQEDLDSRAVYGIGVISSVSGNDIVVNGGSSLLCVGDKILNSSDLSEISTITNIQGDTLTLDNPTTLTNVFILGKKDSRIEGSNLRGYTMKIDLENSEDTLVELFAVNSEIKKSFTS